MKCVRQWGLTYIRAISGFFGSVDVMSKQAAEFVEGWIHQNLTYLDRGGDFIRAMELADKC